MILEAVSQIPAGLEVELMPIPDLEKPAGPWSLRWQVFLDLMLEVAKVGCYAVRGWT